MKRLLTAAFALAFQAAASAATVAGPIQPSISITASNGSVRVFQAGDADVKVSQGAGDSVLWTIGTFDWAGASFGGISFNFDPDPFLAFSIGATNLTANVLNFAITFTAPYVGGPYDWLSSELSATVDSIKDSDLLDIEHDSLVDGSPLLFTGLPDCAGIQMVDCGTVNGSQALAAPTPAGGSFGAVLKFAVGEGDQASLSGSTHLLAQPVVLPEPQSLTLVLAALALVGVATRLPRQTR